MKTKQVPSKSYIFWRDIVAEGEVNGRWVVEHRADDVLYPAGTVVSEPAGPDDTDDMTFTAKNGKRYMDCPSGTQWTPREK